MILLRAAGEGDHAKHGGGSSLIPLLSPFNRAESHDNLFPNAPRMRAGLSCSRLFGMRGRFRTVRYCAGESGACGLSWLTDTRLPGSKGAQGHYDPCCRLSDLRFRPSGAGKTKPE
jgi:hypothetical protein